MSDDDARFRAEGLSTSLAPASFRPRASAPPSDTGRDIAGEDFLFHLYRGSELLQDSRVHEAKEELEQALHLQPRDPKGQDLLAVVYFRLGLYPRAIQIYETLKSETDQPSLRINLALCYLKTGQAAAARLELEDVVRSSPEHQRAWGYLGLAYERLGDLGKAEEAFTRGGHASMARKIAGRRGATMPPQQVEENVDPAESTAIRAAAAEAFQELDAGELSFALAEPATSRRDQGPWRAIEHGQIARTQTRISDLPPRSVTLGANTGVSMAATVTSPPAPSAEALRIESMVGVRGMPQLVHSLEGPVFTEMTPPRSSPPLMISRPTSAPPTAEIPLLSELARGVRIGSRAALGDTIVVDASGLVVLRLRSPLNPGGGGTEEPAQEFAVRFDALRAYTGAFQTSSLERRGRGASPSETFGGIATPLLSVRGEGDLIFGPRPSRQLNVCTLRDDVLFLREDTIVLFDLALTYENGRLPRTDEEPLPMVQLRGSGAVAFDVIERLRTIDVSASRPATIRGQSVVGWMGRIIPRAVPVAEAPAGQRGLLGFAGDGTIFLVGK
ncbi:MAG: tetratricopeptide repeat protein [Polyangiaceae bacterium]